MYLNLQPHRSWKPSHLTENLARNLGIIYKIKLETTYQPKQVFRYIAVLYNHI